MTGRERILSALAQEPVDRLPVWMMRQAGRYLPGYSALRREHTFMQMVSSVDLSLQISLEPVDRLDIDAAIVFHDILIPFDLMGLKLNYVDGIGPLIDPAIRTEADVLRLQKPVLDDSLTVVKTLGRLRERLGRTKAVFGFAGAPLTMATYAVEGGSDKSRPAFLQMARTDSTTLCALLDHLALIQAEYLVQQAACADVLQIFESHADLLPADQYMEVGFPALQRMIEHVRSRCPEIPLILFGNGLSGVFAAVRDLDITAVSVDSATPLSEAAAALTRGAGRFVLQGNADPGMLLQSPPGVERFTERFLFESAAMLGHDEGQGLPTGWIVNLGQGVRPPTDPKSAQAFVRTVHAFQNRAGSLP